MIEAIRIWVSTLLLPENLAKVVRAIRIITDVLEVALPIVRDIDLRLKPLLEDEENKMEVLWDWLLAYGKQEEAERLASLPWVEMIQGAAEAAIGSQSPGQPRRALRVSSELAYWVYVTFK